MDIPRPIQRNGHHKNPACSNDKSHPHCQSKQVATLKNNLSQNLNQVIFLNDFSFYQSVFTVYETKTAKDACHYFLTKTHAICVAFFGAYYNLKVWYLTFGH